MKVIEKIALRASVNATVRAIAASFIVASPPTSVYDRAAERRGKLISGRGDRHSVDRDEPCSEQPGRQRLVITVMIRTLEPTTWESARPKGPCTVRPECYRER